MSGPAPETERERQLRAFANRLLAWPGPDRPSRVELMPQQGVITEAEFAKIVMITSSGRLVPTRAVADDDRRDFEIHIRRHFGESLAIQLKTAKRLRLHGPSRLDRR